MKATTIELARSGASTTIVRKLKDYLKNQGHYTKDGYYPVAGQEHFFEPKENEKPKPAKNIKEAEQQRKRESDQVPQNQEK